MADQFPSLPDGSRSTKSFWERPEGTTGMITIAAIGAGLYFALPALNKLAWGLASFIGGLVGMAVNLMFLIVVGAACAGLLWVLFNPNFRMLCKYIFKSGMRKVTGMFIEIDPIGIMKTYVESMKEKKGVFDSKKTQLSGQISTFKATIDKNQKEADNALRMVDAAKKANQPKEVTFYSREYGRYTDANKQFNATLTKMQMLYQFMGKYQEACDFVIRDLVSEVKIREQERSMSLAGHSAIKSAMSILKGSGAEKELFDQAMEFVVDDFAAKMGEIDSFMEDTESILNGINLQNGMWESEAEKKLLEFENKSDSLVLGGTKRLILENNSATLPAAGLSWTSAQPVPVNRSSTPGGGDYISKFLDTDQK